MYMEQTRDIICHGLVTRQLSPIPLQEPHEFIQHLPFSLNQR